MRKGRKKKSVKPPAASNLMQSIDIALPESICREDLQNVIACAIVEAEKMKAQEEEKRREAALSEWYDIIGYEKEAKGRKRVFNEIKVFFKIMFLPKKDIKGNTASTVLIKSFITIFFWVMKWLSLLIAAFLVAYPQIAKNSNHFPRWPYLCFVLYAITFFIFSRLFRMASIENDKLDDRNYLFALFTSITSFVSMIVAVIAVIKGG